MAGSTARTASSRSRTSGTPGTWYTKRQRLNGGIWRYHPTKHIFEVFAEGTSNPWGLDFNDYGHAFTTACVIEHLYYVVQGARYKRQAGKHFNPYIYDDIETVADHVHWVGRQGPHAGNSRSSSAGGGHAHAGAMIYLGGDTWPSEYRESIFMNNIHGSRANTDRLHRAGLGLPSDARTGLPAGQRFVEPDAQLPLRSRRRRLRDRLVRQEPVPQQQSRSASEVARAHLQDQQRQRQVGQSRSPEAVVRAKLVELQLQRNDWYVRHARRILQERGPDPAVHAALKRILRDNPDVTRKLRALWALHVTDGLNEEDLLELLGHENEYVRSWAVYLTVAFKNAPTPALRRFARMANEDPSPLVRLYLASAMQRVPAEKRWDVVTGLLAHDEDADDHNLPMMVWYAAEPVVPLDMPRALDLAAASRLPHVFPFTVRRIAAAGTEDALRVLTDRLGRTSNRAQRLDLVDGITQIVGPR